MRQRVMRNGLFPRRSFPFNLFRNIGHRRAAVESRYRAPEKEWNLLSLLRTVYTCVHVTSRAGEAGEIYIHIYIHMTVRRICMFGFVFFCIWCMWARSITLMVACQCTAAVRIRGRGTLAKASWSMLVLWKMRFKSFSAHTHTRSFDSNGRPLNRVILHGISISNFKIFFISFDPLIRRR